MLTRNAAQCVGCLKVIESEHRHDYRTHRCARVAMGVARRVWFAVDGGTAYERRNWGGPGLVSDPDQHFVDRNEYESR